MLLHLAHPYKQERSTASTGPIWILEATHSSLGCVTLASLPSNSESS